MNAGVDVVLAGIPWHRVLGLVIDVSIKAAVIVTAAWFVTLLLRRSPARARSMVWIFALAALLALPLARTVTPLWDLSLIPDVGDWFPGSGARSALVMPVDNAKDPLAAPDTGADAAVAAEPARAVSGRWPALIVCAWAAGAVLGFLWLGVRAIAGRRMLRRCAAADGSWADILDEVCAKLRLCSRPKIFESPDIDAAVTVGAINPSIVVPAGSSSWPQAQRVCIMAHEVAHIERRDGIVELLAVVATGVYWFNPFVWAAARSLRIERERDCDDAVLGAGAKPSEYASFLLDLAAAMSARREPAWRLSTISQGSNLKERIMSILDPTIDRNRGRRRAGLVSCLLLASVVVPLSISGIWETQAQEQKKCDKTKKEEQLKKEQYKKEHSDKMLKMSQTEALKAGVEKMSKEEWDKLSDEEKAEYKEKLAHAAKMNKEEQMKAKWEEIETQEGSLAVQVHRAIEEDGPEAAAKIVKKYKAAGDDDYYAKEGEFNVLGYLYLHDKKIDEAIAVFKANVELYPDSWNTYDSLGEAMFAAGKCEKARMLYEKSLALNPDNENGQKMLAKIEQCEKKGSYAKSDE